MVNSGRGKISETNGHAPQVQKFITILTLPYLQGKREGKTISLAMDQFYHFTRNQQGTDISPKPSPSFYLTMLLFSTDIDGTVYNNTDSTARFAEYWSTLRDTHGYPKLAYNTGRSLDDTLALIASTKLPTPDYIISGVGTSITDGEGKSPLSGFLNTLRDDWEFDTAFKIVDAIDGPHPQPPECQNPYKCSWFWDNATAAQLDDLLSALTQSGIKAQAIYSSNRDLDLLPVAANKANALLHLTYHLDLPRSEVVVAGDSGNDAAMLSLDGANAIAVANAEPALINALQGTSFFHASKICADGVIEGLQHYASQHPST